jgi:uncharacterized membrane protein YgaE (UPF0421/DUF939 family)
MKVIKVSGKKATNQIQPNILGVYIAVLCSYGKRNTKNDIVRAK